MWVSINDFSRYEVSRSGVIRNAKTKRPIKSFKNKDGYMRTQLLKDNGEKKNIFVHVVVANAYLSNESNLTDVNHKNNRRHDNRVVNLEFVTHSDNMKQTWKTGRNRKRRKKQG